MPASSPPSVGRSRIVALPRAGSAPLHKPLVAPAHTVPRLSSLRLQPSRLKAISCWSFTPARPVYPAASLRDFLSGAYTAVLLGATGTESWAIVTVHRPKSAEDATS